LTHSSSPARAICMTKAYMHGEEKSGIGGVQGTGGRVWLQEEGHDDQQIHSGGETVATLYPTLAHPRSHFPTPSPSPCPPTRRETCYLIKKEEMAREGLGHGELAGGLHEAGQLQQRPALG
jgi:hypothetical protein